MKISDDYDFSEYDVNVQEFVEDVRHILNFGLYDVKYITEASPSWTTGSNEHPMVLSKHGAVGILYIGDANTEKGWWGVVLTAL